LPGHEELTPEQIEKLLEKAKETEWKYLLRIEEWSRQGPAYTDYAEFELVYGKADRVKLEDWDAGYPYAAGTTYLIIPKTVPTVILWRHVTDEATKEVLYIFTRDGWKEVEV